MSPMAPRTSQRPDRAAPTITSWRGSTVAAVRASLVAGSSEASPEAMASSSWSAWARVIPGAIRPTANMKRTNRSSVGIASWERVEIKIQASTSVEG